MARHPEDVFYILSRRRVLCQALIGKGTGKKAPLNRRRWANKLCVTARRVLFSPIITPAARPGISNADHHLTTLIFQALGAIGIPVLVYVIVANDQAYRFATEGVSLKYTE